MKHLRPSSHQTQQVFAALVLTSIVSLGTGLTVVDAASAKSLEPTSGTTSEMLKRPNEVVASSKQSRNKEVPVGVVNAVRREIFSSYKIPPGQLRVVSASSERWSDSCLGLGKPEESCAVVLIENGWRIVMSDGRQSWTYRTDGTGRIVRLETAGNSNSSNLPNSVADAVLRAASEQLGVPRSQLKITQAQQQTWPDRCLGLGSPVELCASALTPGWRVTVEGKQQRLVYHTDTTGSLIRLNKNESNLSEANLPQSVADAVIRVASKDLGVSSSQLKIIKAQQQTWGDSCLGLPRPTERCMGTPTPGWRVTVVTRQKVQIYRTDTTGERIRAEAIVGQPASVRNLPDAVAKAVLQDAARRANLSVSQLRIVQAEERDWPDGCLGLAAPGQGCTRSIVPGWRVTVEGGRQTFVYRTNESGSVIKLESGATQGNSGAVQIPKSELPAPLAEGVVFRAISSGGITGNSYETVLTNNGQVIRRLSNPMIKAPAQMHQISRQELRQFQQLLERQKFSQFNQLAYPAPSGAADYITVSLTSQSGTTRYADMVQNQLPAPLQSVIQAWNQIASRK
ncbi:MAG: hypothetical protein M3O33_10560 [Cyanobacteriota bacterium]|nr:hypothetical protein [Cyanobacteriota bacterium]